MATNRNVNDTEMDNLEKAKTFYIILDNVKGKPVSRETPYSQTFFVYTSRHWAEKFASRNSGYVFSIQGLYKKHGFDLDCEGDHRAIVRLGYTVNNNAN